jgi:hypothetical protein
MIGGYKLSGLAETVEKGTAPVWVVADSLTVRESPSASGKSKGTVKKGDYVPDAQAGHGYTVDAWRKDEKKGAFYYVYSKKLDGYIAWQERGPRGSGSFKVYLTETNPNPAALLNSFDPRHPACLPSGSYVLTITKAGQQPTKENVQWDRQSGMFARSSGRSVRASILLKNLLDKGATVSVASAAERPATAGGGGGGGGSVFGPGTYPGAAGPVVPKGEPFTAPKEGGISKTLLIGGGIAAAALLFLLSRKGKGGASEAS